MSDRDIPPDEVLIAAGWVRIGRRTRRIQSRPRVGQYFWVDFPRDAFAPEFVGEHPGIIVRAAKKLDHDTCVVIPVTSKPQQAAHIHKLRTNPNPRGNAQKIEAFAICDHFYTVNVSRLRPVLNDTGQAIYPRVGDDDLREIAKCLKGAFSTMLALAESVSEVATPESSDPKPEVSSSSGRKILTLPKGS